MEKIYFKTAFINNPKAMAIPIKAKTLDNSLAYLPVALTQRSSMQIATLLIGVFVFIRLKFM